MTKHNKISVLMPVHNMQETVGEAIASVLGQEGVPFELVIVNDGSTDDTLTEINKFDKDKNLKVISQPKLGKNTAFNRAFVESSGSFICYFAGDDVLPDNSLFFRYSLLDDKHNSDAISCGKLKTFSKDKKMNGIIMPKMRIPCFTGGVIMFPRSLAEKVFPLPVELPNEDTWTKLVIQHFAKEVLISDNVVLYYRIHDKNTVPKNTSYNEINQKKHHRMKVYQLFLDKYGARLNKEDREKIISIIEMEEKRYLGKIFSIIFQSNVGFRDKANFFFYSKAYLYYLKNYLYRFLGGWNY